MNEREATFYPIRNGDGYRATIPGSMLQEAQRGPVYVPVKDPINPDRMVDLAAVGWYDEKNVSGRMNSIYDNIQKLQFDGTADYTLFYIDKVRIPYMLAMKLPS